jgi:hypothetical protein
MGAQTANQSKASALLVNARGSHMKSAWILAALALACCGPKPTQSEAPAADSAPAAVEAPTAAAARAGTHCVAGEAAVFNCAIEGKTASVCVGPQTVTYRFGPPGAPETEVASTGADGRAHGSEISRAGAKQSAVRFSDGTNDYIVHAASGGGIQASAGITVLRGEATVSRSECPDAARHQFRSADVPVQDEAEERYRAWW